MDGSPHLVTDQVWVRLTPLGERILEEYNAGVREVLLGGFTDAEIGEYGEKTNTAGWWTGELYKLMTIFGSACRYANTHLFEKGEVYFTQPI